MSGWAWWEHLTTRDFARLDPATTVAVLPVAAVEQHGPHLPLGTDAIICKAILDAALARLDPEPGRVLRLPIQRIGCSPEHESFPGTLSLPAEAVIGQWEAIGRQVAAAGLTKLVLFNTHGGQVAAVDIVAVRLRRVSGLLVVRASYFHKPPPDGLVPAAEQAFGWHGGLIETALMLHIAPALVRSDRIAGFASAAETMAAAGGLTAEGVTGIGWLAEDLNPAGVTGDARAATPELGARLLDHYARHAAAVIAAARRHPWPPADPG
jgi:creatinine amidohydrolase